MQDDQAGSALTWVFLLACASKIALVEVDFELLPRCVWWQDLSRPS